MRGKASQEKREKKKERRKRGSSEGERLTRRILTLYRERLLISDDVIMEDEIKVTLSETNRIKKKTTFVPYSFKGRAIERERLLGSRTSHGDQGVFLGRVIERELSLCL